MNGIMARPLTKSSDCHTLLLILSDAFVLIFSDKSTVSGCQHGHKSSVKQSMAFFCKTCIVYSLPKTTIRLSLLHNTQMSVKSGGGPFAYEKWGGPTFYSSKVGGSNFKVGGS